MHTRGVRVGLLLALVVGLAGCGGGKLPLPPEREQALPQWPVWGGNLRHTANAADSVEFYVGPTLGRELWSRRVPGEVDGSPSIYSDGTVYVGSGPANLSADSGFVQAFRPDGSLKWRVKTGAPMIMSGALGLDGTYYLADDRGVAYAIDVKGTLRWKHHLGRMSGSHPVILPNGVLVFPGERRLWALEPGTGEVVWEVPRESITIDLSVSSEGVIYVAAENVLAAIDHQGTLLWQKTYTRSPGEVMIGSDGTLYFQLHGDSLLYALSPDGTPKWTFNIGANSDFQIPSISPRGELYVIKPITPQELVIVNSDGTLVRRINLVQISGAQGGVSVIYSYAIVDLEGTAYLSFLPEGGAANFYAIRHRGLLKWKVMLAPDHPLLPPTRPALAPDGMLYITSDYFLHAVN